MKDKPVYYSEDVATELCERLASGEALVKICQDEHMPDRMNVWRWTSAIPPFAALLTRARLAQADSLADEVTHIADTDEDPQRARNRMDARKWATKVINPARYGERLDLNINEKPDLAGIRAASLAQLPAATKEALTLPDMDDIVLTTSDPDPEDMLS